MDSEECGCSNAVLNNTLRKNRRWGAQVLSLADAQMLQLVDGANRHP